MGMTIEFFSAHPQELVSVFSLPDEEIDRYVEALAHYPTADFSFHLLLPEDMDQLCQSMRKHRLLVPSTFRELLVEQLWYDGSSESLTLVTEAFAHLWSRVETSKLAAIAKDWMLPFPFEGPLEQTPAYQSLLELREISRDVVTRKTSLLLHLLGSPYF